jgi:hypothetical protein
MTISKTLQTLRRRRRHMASHLCELVNGYGFCRIAVVLDCRRRQLQPLPRDLERPDRLRAVEKRPEPAIWSIFNNIGAGNRIRTLGRNCSSSGRFVS